MFFLTLLLLLFSNITTIFVATIKNYISYEKVNSIN